ncbi:ficolin-2-like [Gigantopelta aegis]|uniref:ficolin-2-like n=1 Tax=Gigantopelta aegis TaxID=1735272 RepID=UPI001B88A3B5|nr:ficolin-2-like [Gigantopelta aegis]
MMTIMMMMMMMVVVMTATTMLLVIQRRTDGSEDFYRTWNEYRDGFGDLNKEFWLGNTNIQRLTSQGQYDLRIDMEDFEGNTAYAMYQDFSLQKEYDNFRLQIGQYSGNAGDSLKVHNGFRFSAWDKDLDQSTRNCAKEFQGAWWYVDCHHSNLNGMYLRGNHSTLGNGVEWNGWRGLYYSLKTTVMKIRPSPVIQAPKSPSLNPPLYIAKGR